MPTRAVLLDLDETLIPEDEPLAAAYLATARVVWGSQAGDADATRLRESVRSTWRQHAPHPEYRASVNVGGSDGLSSDFPGEDPRLEAIRGFLPRFRQIAFDEAVPPSMRGSGERLLEVWLDERVASQGVYPGAPELLRELRGRCRLALVTNGPSDLQRRKLAITALDSYFDVVVASCDIGAGKPQAAIFDTALGHLGIAADEAVMVGNDKHRDIEGAIAAGIRAIWVQHGDSGSSDVPSDLFRVQAELRSLLDG